MGFFPGSFMRAVSIALWSLGFSVWVSVPDFASKIASEKALLVHPGTSLDDHSMSPGPKGSPTLNMQGCSLRVWSKVDVPLPWSETTTSTSARVAAKVAGACAGAPFAGASFDCCTGTGARAFSAGFGCASLEAAAAPSSDCTSASDNVI